jgi:O-antigen/teichoic acid export membrane protein
MPTGITGLRKSKLPTTIEQPVQADIVKPPPRLLAPSSLLARNAVLNFITEGWTFVVLVLAMPKLVAYWGETSFGLFSLAWVVIGYLSFLDIGVNRAATKFISEHLADRDDDAVRGLVRTSFLANLTFGLAGAVFVLLASPYLVHSVFKISGALQREARLVFFAVALAVPMLLVQGIFRAVLSSYQRFGWINSVNAVTMTAQWGSAIWLAWRGHGVAVVVLATVVTRLLGTLAYGVLLYRLLPGIRLWGAGGLSGLAKLLKFGTWVSISQVISPLLVYLDRILIASFVSLGAVTLYTVPYEVMTRLRIIPASLATTLYPAFSERGIEGQQHQLQSLYERSVRYLLLLLLPSVLFLVILGPDLLKIWMGAGFASQTTAVLQILAIGVLANGMSYVPYNMLQAVGRPDLTAKFHLCELVPYVLLCLVLIPRWGISGAAAASAFRFSLDFCLLLWATAKYGGCSLKEIRHTIVYRIVPLTTALGIALTLVHYGFSTSGSRLLLGVVSLLLYIPGAWFLAVDRGDKPAVSEAVKLFLGQPAT